jgi:hypothetical protein
MAKKLVRAADLPDDESKKAFDEQVANWKPTPEAKQQATTLRIIALVAWVVAIGLEAFAIFWMLKQDPFTTTLLIWLCVVIVVIGALSVTGSLLWKKSNRLDPASKKDTVRFFVQNQLGAFIAVLAFLPLIVMVLTNKNMDGRQKAIAGGLAAVLAVVAIAFGVEPKPVSTEDVVANSNQVVQLTGKDEVFWTKSGEVYHLCQAASAVNLQSKDNQIFSGTVAQAVANGKSRLTKQVDQELKQCGITPPSATASASASAEPAASDSASAEPSSTPS